MNPYEIASRCLEETGHIAPEDVSTRLTKMAAVIDSALTAARDAALEKAARECDAYNERHAERLQHLAAADARGLWAEARAKADAGAALGATVRALKSPGARR